MNKLEASFCKSPTNKNEYLYKSRGINVSLNINMVCIGASTALKNTPLVSAKPPTLPILGNSSPMYWFFVTPLNIEHFSEPPIILKFLILNTIPSFEK